MFPSDICSCNLVLKLFHKPILYEKQLAFLVNFPSLELTKVL